MSGNLGASRGGGGSAGGSLRSIDWSRENLRPFQKNFYREHAAVSRRSQVTQLFSAVFALFVLHTVVWLLVTPLQRFST